MKDTHHEFDSADRVTLCHDSLLNLSPPFCCYHYCNFSPLCTLLLSVLTRKNFECQYHYNFQGKNCERWDDLVRYKDYGGLFYDVLQWHCNKWTHVILILKSVDGIWNVLFKFCLKFLRMLICLIFLRDSILL